MENEPFRFDTAMLVAVARFRLFYNTTLFHDGDTHSGWTDKLASYLTLQEKPTTSDLLPINYNILVLAPSAFPRSNR